jgi:alkaline phosphatase
MQVNRRHFLQHAGVGTVLMGSMAATAAPATKPARFKGDRPTRIIHLVADGLSQGMLTCADYYCQMVQGRSLRWVELMHDPRATMSWMNMRSLNSLVTDSAAASSSWGCGSRVKNGSLNVLPDGRELLCLYQLFGQQGWKRGLVTTTEITHATPAGFAANVGARGDADLIATQYLDREVEVLLGGGQKFFDPAKRKDHRDVWADYRQRGYAVFKTRAEFQAARSGARWLGTFAESHLPFTLDRQGDAALVKTVPTLAEMTQGALKRLELENRFILQVEGGRVDHACHACDAPAAIHDMMAFDEAVEVALRFQARHPQTLIVITTDHGNGNPGLNGTGDSYGDSNKVFKRILRVRRSFAEMAKRMEKLTAGKEAEQVADIIAEGTDYRPSPERAASLVPFLNKKGFAMYEHMNSSAGQMGQLLANHIGIGWSGSAHTADYVPLVALGPGAEAFRGFIQNTEVFERYLAMAGIDFRNPSSPLVAAAGPAASEVESPADWV